MAVNGNNATLTAYYQNTGATSMTVNVYLATEYPNGTILYDGVLFYPQGPQVTPNNGFPIDVNIGPLSSGTYTVTFYVEQEVTGNQVSISTTVSVTIP